MTTESQVACLSRTLNGVAVHQRRSDGYVNATELCRAAGKKWNDYWRLGATQDFVNEMSVKTGIPVLTLVQVTVGGGDDSKGSWVHPKLAVDLARWCSAKFAVQVAEWVYELMTTGSVTMPKAEAVTVGQIEDVVRRVLSEARPSNGGPGWTIQQRLAEHRWFGTTKKQREQIRKTVNNLVHTVLGQEVEQLNGTNVYTRGQLHMLDKAIEIVRHEAERLEAIRAPDLFAAAR